MPLRSVVSESCSVQCIIAFIFLCSLVSLRVCVKRAVFVRKVSSMFFRTARYIHSEMFPGAGWTRMLCRWAAVAKLPLLGNDHSKEMFNPARDIYMWAFARTGVTHSFVLVLVWEQICSKPKHFWFVCVFWWKTIFPALWLCFKWREEQLKIVKSRISARNRHCTPLCVRHGHVYVFLS